MNFQPIILEGFEGREEALARVQRYIHFITPLMFYRTNDLIHSRRVLWHLEAVIPDILTVYGDSFDINFARTLALVHDDVEIITNDIPVHDKENMSAEEREVFHRAESEAVDKLVEMYGSIANGYNYSELLNASKEKSKLEAQLVSYCDKLDGLGEAFHEVSAGNQHFLLPSGGKDGKKGGYVRRINDFPTKYPVMARFFERFPDYLPKPFDFKSTAEKGFPHTKSSLEIDSGYPQYERWKRTVMKREGIELLITQLEFNPI